jgi:hypothetical protein
MIPHAHRAISREGSPRSDQPKAAIGDWRSSLVRAPRSNMVDASGRFGQSFLGQASLLYRADDCTANLCDRILIRQPPTDAKGVTSRDQGADSALGDAISIAQASHLEAVCDGQPLELKLTSEQVGHDPAADGPRHVIYCRD